MIFKLPAEICAFLQAPGGLAVVDLSFADDRVYIPFRHEMQDRPYCIFAGVFEYR